MKYVQHARSGDITKLPNEDAHLLVSSGRYVYSSKFESRKSLVPTGHSLPWRIFLFVTTLAMIVAALLLSSSARAADLKVPKLVPYQACLTQAQARQVYPDKHLRFREIGKERCWYAGKTLPKHAFNSRAGAKQVLAPSTKPFASQGSAAHVLNRGFDSPDGSQFPRATGVAVKPTRLIQQEHTRVEGPDVSITSAGTITYTGDAFEALTGLPETFFTFDNYWNLMTGWER